MKKHGVPARAVFDKNRTSYKHRHNGIPALFVFNALFIASNSTDSRVGWLTADWEMLPHGHLHRDRNWTGAQCIEREDELCQGRWK